MARRRAYSLEYLVPCIPIASGDLQVNYCRYPECLNCGKPASADDHKPYEGGRNHRGGGNRHPAGATCRECDRDECNPCHRKFTVRLNALRGQDKPEKNAQGFMKLVNRAPLKRIFEDAGTGGGTICGKMDFFFTQCRAFAGEIERRLVDGTRSGFQRPCLSTDVQEYVSIGGLGEGTTRQPMNEYAEKEGGTS